MATVNQGAVRDDEPYVEAPYHPLQTLDLCVQNTSFDAPWVIYIHGGAWRDPKITKSSGHRLLRQQLLHNPSLNAATINYRLSPHPSYPGEDSHAIHPGHLNDVLAALLYLKTSYGLCAKQYILVGHSAGATLVFQVLAALYDYSLFPYAVVGVEGIYDLVSLVDEYPDYAGFVSGAFGEDKEVWKGASPVWISRDWAGYAGYRGRIILIQSDNDELLSWRQTREFKDTVNARHGQRRNRALVVRAQGKHDDVPDGKELANVIRFLLVDLEKGKQTEGRQMAPELRHML